MPNPILNGLFQMSGAAPIMQAIKNGGNPTMLIRQMAQSNPQLQPIVQALDQGADPQQLFYKLCQQKGVDPSTILNQMK